MYTLYRNPIHYDTVDIDQAYKFQRTIRTIFAFDVHSGYDYKQKTRDLVRVKEKPAAGGRA